MAAIAALGILVLLTAAGGGDVIEVDVVCRELEVVEVTWGPSPAHRGGVNLSLEWRYDREPRRPCPRYFLSGGVTSGCALPARPGPALLEIDVRKGAESIFTRKRLASAFLQPRPPANVSLRWTLSDPAPAVRVTCPALPLPGVEYAVQLRGAWPGAAWEVSDVTDTPTTPRPRPRWVSGTSGIGGHAHSHPALTSGFPKPRPGLHSPVSPAHCAGTTPTDPQTRPQAPSAPPTHPLPEPRPELSPDPAPLQTWGPAPSCDLTVGGVDPRRCYDFRVRAAPRAEVYGREARPSAWSPVTSSRGAWPGTCEPRPATPTLGIPVTFALAALVTSLLLLLALCRLRRLTSSLLPGVPDPRGGFRGLFERHGGDFQDWISHTEGVAAPPKAADITADPAHLVLEDPGKGAGPVGGATVVMDDDAYRSL